MGKDSRIGKFKHPRLMRYFSEDFKKDIVHRIERKEYTVREVSKLYEVSVTAVYKWVYKYSTLHMREHRQIIEPLSMASKVKQLQARIKELEQAVGQKQIKIDYLEKMIEMADEHYAIEIKKKLDSRPRSGSGKTGEK